MTPRQRVNYAIKSLASYVLYYTGLLRLWQAIVMRNKAVVLMYHRVLTREERQRSGSHAALVVDRDTFAMQMAVLKDRFTVLSIDQFAERLEKRVPFSPSSCLITFDDGWCDNFTNALPILSAHGLPFLVFLPVKYIGSNRLFWQEELVHLLVAAVQQSKTDAALRGRLEPLLAAHDLDGVLDVRDEDPREQIIQAIGDQKRLSRAAMERFLVGLRQATGIALDELASIDGFLDWKQVDAMAHDRVAFGGHGADHLLLTQVSSDEAAREITTAKHMIEERGAVSVPTFSYPNGYFTPTIADMVEAAGYRLAFSTKGGFVTCEDDRYAVRRFNVHEAVTGSMPMFLARVVGLW